MIKKDGSKINYTLYSVSGVILFLLFLYSCANIGTPDGGAYDELPPKFLRSTPPMGTLNNNKKRISLEFDEFIKLEKASEKVVVSPPQIQVPEIKANGKRVTVVLEDSLKPNTTYTIDFSDAIVDNNEGNPLDNFTYTFSTGSAIDTMEVAGTVLDASNLEPIKGLLVGLHADLTDSAFVKSPFYRVGRTDERGHFSIRGVAPDSYRVYGLQDANQNYAFDQKSEMIAFDDSIIIPRFEERFRQDTLWKDTLTVDTLTSVKYTHYLPDNILLRAFKEVLTAQYLVKSERLLPQKLSFYFAVPTDTLPVLKGLNFDETNAFFIEKSAGNDTIHYWIRDSLLYKKDTLDLAIRYLYTDTLGMLVPTIDTLSLAARKVFVKEKKKKKNEDTEQVQFLKVTMSAPAAMNIYNNIRLEFDEPVAWFDSAAIHLEEKVDTLWKPVPYVFSQDSTRLRGYELLAGWEPEKEYRVTFDSTAFHGLYGLFTDKIQQTVKVRSLDEYSALYMKVTGVDTFAVVQLLNEQDKVVLQAPVIDGEADFYYLDPGKYYVRMFVDSNRNGKWDTGLYANKRQPEMVYYYPQPLELKAMWEVEQNWNVNQVPLDKQKPEVLKKGRPDENRKKPDRNRNR